MTNESSGAAKPSGMSNFQWLIIALVVAGVAIFTKPDDASFMKKLGEDVIADGACSIAVVDLCATAAIGSVNVERTDFVVARTVVLVNAYQGRMVYVGAFNTWFRLPQNA